MSTTTTRKGNKLPVFHTIGTKRKSVKRINAALKRGDTQTDAVDKETRALGVHYKTIEGWLRNPDINKNAPSNVINTDPLGKILENSNNTIVEITGKTLTEKSDLVTHMTLRLENGSYNRVTKNDIRKINNSEELQAWVK